MAFPVLILDAPNPPLLHDEIERCLAYGLEITLNLHYFADQDSIQTHYAGRIQFVDINCHDTSSLIGAVVEAGGYSVLKTRLNIPLGAALINAAASPDLGSPLQAIAQAGAGLNHIDLKAAAERGVAVLNTPGSNATAVAEYALAQTLFLSRDLNRYNAKTHQGQWSKGLLAPAPQIAELTLGLVGTGRIAQSLAHKARALGMNVIATGSERFTQQAAANLGLQWRASLDELLEEADVVSIHTPLTAQTKGLFDTAAFTRMKPGSILINTARGGIVDEGQLATFMQRFPGHIKGVAIDTFAREKDPFESPLTGVANAILTPHIAGNTRTAISEASMQIVDHIHAFRQAMLEG
ncbi:MULTISPECIES: D-isomer specific 2-hydroxyacid dehydrogenase family protein [unclassified Pseudomonas]|uniref:NAD(P)-dependent oxidoreductase n=1 Tax=unclassified Pseudomonas TaxID=196821 RepID=UPI0015A3C64D|nr:MULTISPECIES: NAD(P)-dependent oxidoreductase [unclassified Pseudomonas]NWC92822.1 NAD(P)-binding domain-containing protein [Pseudomonas sp. IPO3779]NWD17536.1 NAD(P)-binding domain-containing protein [Pseudomonas sp. IPO3778]